MMNEKISAFLDGEASREDTLEILERCTREPALRALLDRQQRVRAALRREAPAEVDDGFADRVMAQIATQEMDPAGKVVELRPRQPRTGFRWAVGLAMAASITAVAILATNSFQSPDTVSPASARNDQITTTPASETRIASEGFSSKEEPAIATRWGELSQEDARQLNGYLISHNNYATDHGFGGAMGFTRVAVSADDELQADR